VFSDIAVAANCILREQPQRVQRILIVDLDVHQVMLYSCMGTLAGCLTV
jgi:hypothetical protein